MRLLSTCNVVSATNELNFKSYLLLINLTIHRHMWLVAPCWTLQPLGPQEEWPVNYK